MSRGTKISAGAVAALAVGLVAYRTYCALLPEETRIRRMIARIEGGFNSGEAGTVWKELAEDFTEEESGLGRNEVRLVLFDFFRNEAGRSGRPLLRVEAPPEELEVEIQEGNPEAAEVSVTARFQARGPKDADWKPYGVILFTAHLSRQDGDWRISRARHKRLEGNWPF